MAGTTSGKVGWTCPPPGSYNSWRRLSSGSYRLYMAARWPELDTACVRPFAYPIRTWCIILTVSGRTCGNLNFRVAWLSVSVCVCVCVWSAKACNSSRYRRQHVHVVQRNTLNCSKDTKLMFVACSHNAGLGSAAILRYLGLVIYLFIYYVLAHIIHSDTLLEQTSLCVIYCVTSLICLTHKVAICVTYDK